MTANGPTQPGKEVPADTSQWHPAQGGPHRRLNEEFVEVLIRVSDTMEREYEPWKARAYRNAAEAVQSYPGDITDPAQLAGVRNIGKSTLGRLEYYTRTGLVDIDKDDYNRLDELINSSRRDELTKIYGIGPKRAKRLMDLGIKSIHDVRSRPELLSRSNKLGLKYFDDLLERIPRTEIDEYNDVLTKTFADVTPLGSTFEIVGSYRRGADTSGDVDLVITNTKNDTKAFNNFVDALIKDRVVLDVLARGNQKCLAISKLPDKRARRIDFLYAPPDEFAFYTLYNTGSAAFNQAQRRHAKKLGYSLNEHGLYHMVGGNKGPKVVGDFQSERLIFGFLGLQYREPKDRVDSSSLVPIEESQDQSRVNMRTGQETSLTSEALEIFVNGACPGKNGPGGWAASFRYQGSRRAISGGAWRTTNNRMAITAATAALTVVDYRLPIRMHTDSEYLYDGITSWLARWKINDWKTTAGKAVENQDLWEELDRLASQRDISWQLVDDPGRNPETAKVEALAKSAVPTIALTAGGRTITQQLTSLHHNTTTDATHARTVGVHEPTDVTIGRTHLLPVQEYQGRRGAYRKSSTSSRAPESTSSTTGVHHLLELDHNVRGGGPENSTTPTRESASSSSGTHPLLGQDHRGLDGEPERSAISTPEARSSPTSVCLLPEQDQLGQDRAPKKSTGSACIHPLHAQDHCGHDGEPEGPHDRARQEWWNKIAETTIIDTYFDGDGREIPQHLTDLRCLMITSDTHKHTAGEHGRTDVTTGRTPSLPGHDQQGQGHRETHKKSSTPAAAPEPTSSTSAVHHLHRQGYHRQGRGTRKSTTSTSESTSSSPGAYPVPERDQNRLERGTEKSPTSTPGLTSSLTWLHQLPHQGRPGQDKAPKNSTSTTPVTTKNSAGIHPLHAQDHHDGVPKKSPSTTPGTSLSTGTQAD